MILLLGCRVISMIRISLSTSRKITRGYLNCLRRDLLLFIIHMRFRQTFLSLVLEGEMPWLVLFIIQISTMMSSIGFPSILMVDYLFMTGLEGGFLALTLLGINPKTFSASCLIQLSIIS